MIKLGAMRLYSDCPTEPRILSAALNRSAAKLRPPFLVIRRCHSSSPELSEQLRIVYLCARFSQSPAMARLIMSEHVHSSPRPHTGRATAIR